jgi:hypothetical protein
MKEVRVDLHSILNRIRTCHAAEGTCEHRWQLSGETLMVVLEPAPLQNSILILISLAAENVHRGGSIVISTKPMTLPLVGSEGAAGRGACIVLSVTARPVSSPKPTGRSQETLDALREVVRKLGGCFSVSWSTVDDAAFRIYLPRLLADREVSEMEHRIRQEPHLQRAMPGS